MLFSASQRIRAFAFVALIALFVAHLGIKELLAWAINDGFQPGQKMQKVHAVPLFFTPFFALQLVTGLRFDDLAVWWRDLSATAKGGVVLIFIGIVAAAGAILLGVDVKQRPNKSFNADAQEGCLPASPALTLGAGYLQR